MSRLTRLVRDLHRRSLWQVMGIFLAASWGVLEAVAFLTEQAGLPDWTPTMALVLLLLGFPVVVATAFVQEGMPGQQADPEEPRGAREGAGAAARDAAGPNLAPGTGSLDLPSTKPSVPVRLLTWKNAILGGVLAFTLLGLSVVAYFVMWTSGIGPVGNLVAQGVIEKGERVVLADFADRTGTGLGEVVTEALRVDLQESAILALVPPTQVEEAMGRMGLDEGAEVTADRAREVAIRDGLKAVIQGEVGPVGSGYLLTASIVEPGGGEVLASFRADAEDEDALLDALERLSSDIREKAGESLRIIRAGPGLDQVTTSSLEALRLYAEAVEMADRGEEMEAIPLLEEALRLDPDFAMAHRKLSVALGNLGIQPVRMRAAATRAYELRDRLTELEWGRAEAYYRMRVENNLDRAIEAWQRLVERYPSDHGIRNNIGAAAILVGRPAHAVEALRPLFAEGARPSALNYDNFIKALWDVGERDEAKRYAERLYAEFPESRQAVRLEHLIAAAERDWETALSAVTAEIEGRAGAPAADILSRTQQAGYYYGLGRPADAERALELAAQAALDHRQWEWYWNLVVYQRVTAAWALHHPDPEPARAALREGLATLSLDSLDLRAPGASNAAVLFALVGWTERADSLRQPIDDAFETTEKGRSFQVGRQRYLAHRALGSGSGAEAREALRRLEELAPCPAVCSERLVRGLLYEAAGDADRAVAAYEAGIETAPLYQVAFEAAFLPLAFDRLATLYEEIGDADRAATTARRMESAYRDAGEPVASRLARVRRRHLPPDGS